MAVGDGVGAELLDELAAGLARIFGVSCQVRGEMVDAEPAYDVSRNQYHSTVLLRELAPLAPTRDRRVLGVTARDLFVPVLTFVFG